MADQPPVFVLRRALALIPLLLFTTSRLFARYVFGTLARTFRALHIGTHDHVVWMFLIAHRWLAGKPTWVVEDLLYAKRQPWSKRSRAIADAEPGIVWYVCQCDDKRCPGRNGTYLPRAYLAIRGAAGGIEDLVNAELKRVADSMPPEPADNSDQPRPE